MERLLRGADQIILGNIKCPQSKARNRSDRVSSKEIKRRRRVENVAKLERKLTERIIPFSGAA
jgi:hypothetical protein